jgi:hypothetical protein
VNKVGVGLDELIMLLLLVLALLVACQGQLEIDIRRYGEDAELNSECQHTVLTEYSFPSGFSTDWFITSYQNIPAEGITGLLHKFADDGCSLVANSFTRHNCSLAPCLNFSRILLLGVNQHHCTVLDRQGDSFDAVITSSLGDKNLDIRSIYDRSEVRSNGLSLAVVSMPNSWQQV